LKGLNIRVPSALALANVM